MVSPSHAVRGGEVSAGAVAEVHGAPSHLQHQPDHGARLPGHARPPEAHVHVPGGAGLRDPPW